MKLNGSGDVIWATNGSTTASAGANSITRGAITGGYGGITWDGNTLTAAGAGYDVFMAPFNPGTGTIIGLDSLSDDSGYSDYGTAITSTYTATLDILQKNIILKSVCGNK